MTHGFTMVCPFCGKKGCKKKGLCRKKLNRKAAAEAAKRSNQKKTT